MNTIKINPGQIFEVEGKKYVIVLPQNATDEVNDHGQKLFLLTNIQN